MNKKIQGVSQLLNFTFRLQKVHLGWNGQHNSTREGGLVGALKSSKGSCLQKATARSKAHAFY